MVDAVQTVRRLLGDTAEPRTPYLLRPHQPGDMGWIVHRQAILYAEEYGWDGTYEAPGGGSGGAIHQELRSQARTLPGLQKRMEKGLVPSLSLRNQTQSQSCVCCTLKRKRVGWELASGSLRNASASRDKPGTRR